jgi:hypothetical protein
MSAFARKTTDFTLLYTVVLSTRERVCQSAGRVETRPDSSRLWSDSHVCHVW